MSACLSWARGGRVQSIGRPDPTHDPRRATERDGQTLFEICGRLASRHGLGSTRQAISQHLDVLEAAGLVTTRRDGRYKFHHINTGPLEPIWADG